MHNLIKTFREYLAVHPQLKLDGHTMDEIALGLARLVPVCEISQTAVTGTFSADVPANVDGLAWAAGRWAAEVKNRPLMNVHRRSLDDAWRQVIRYFGGNPDQLVGPAHDDLLAAQAAEAA